MQKRNLRSALIIVLIIALLLGSVAGYFLLTLQPESTVTDRTTDPTGSSVPSGSTAATDPNASEPGGTDTENPSGDEPIENIAVLSQNVTSFTDDIGDQINDAILSLEPTEDGVQMRITAGTSFDSLGIGDVFFLEGSEETPFGCTYIGKVSSVIMEDGTASYLLETPGIEEVFDQLSFDYQTVLDEDNIVKIECLEGISCSLNQSLSSDGENGKIKPLVTLEDKLDEPLIFEVEYEKDLLEAFGIKPKEPDIKNEEIDREQAQHVTVLRTAKGQRYHKQDCPHMLTNKTKTETTVTEAKAAGLTPCKTCKPPVIQDEDDPYSAKFTIKGSFGLESLTYGLTCDWNILSGDGLKTLSIYADGKTTSSLTVAVDAELELGGKTTRYFVLGNCLEFEGLKEKMFPLAYIHIAPGAPITLTEGSGIESLRTLTGVLPVSLVAIVYVDFAGNITVGFEAGLSHEVNFYYKNTVYSNYQYIGQEDYDKTETTTFNVSAEIKGDADGHFGVGLEAYVFNLKLAQLEALQIGAEAEGVASIEYTKNLQTGEDQVETETDFYSRIYCKICELDLAFKMAAELGPITVSGNVDLNFGPIWDITFAEWGTKKPTKFSESTMTYSHITASDSEAIYYKDLDGTLVREDDNIRSVIYSDDFFCICGIDETYLYLLQPTGYSGYNIVRVSKDGESSRTIVENISNCLTMDSNYFYVLYSFDTTSIFKVDRYTLDSTEFATFDYPVTYMAKASHGFHVVTEESDILSILFGATYRYTDLNFDGVIIAEYDTNPPVANMSLGEFGSYYVAKKVVSSGYLRSTASEVHWLSKDKSASVLTECLSGWNYFDAGIVTTLRNDMGGSDPYKLVLYRAADGSQTNITTVSHDHALFTICQGPQGEWYYFDQVDSQLILYTMSADFSNKTPVKIFSSSEMRCNLDECGVSILNNRIYFYTMTDSSHCSVLYRYDIT